MLNSILVFLCLCISDATRTVPASTVVTVRDHDHYQSLRLNAPQHAIFFFDPSCPKSAQLAKTFTRSSRHLLDREILPMRIDTSKPEFDALRRRLMIGGAPKFLFRNESSSPPQSQRFRSRANFSLTDWIHSLGTIDDHRQYTLDNSHSHVTNPLHTHAVLFLNPHATSEHHLHSIRAFRRALSNAPHIHHYYTHFDGEHHHLLNDFGLLQHTGHPDYHHDRIIFSCRDAQGRIVPHHAFESVPNTNLSLLLTPHFDICSDYSSTRI